MAAFIALVNFTDQGARNIKDTPARYEAFKAAAEGLGVNVRSALWTQGAYDLVLQLEGPEDAMMALSLRTASLGNVRTQTLRGFNAAEIRKVIDQAFA